jgi:hypothetical protein
VIDPATGLRVVVLRSTCSACGAGGYHYLADRECFWLLCLACLAGPCGCDTDPIAVEIAPADECRWTRPDVCGLIDPTRCDKHREAYQAGRRALG